MICGEPRGCHLPPLPKSLQPGAGHWGHRNCCRPSRLPQVGASHRHGDTTTSVTRPLHPQCEPPKDTRMPGSSHPPSPHLGEGDGCHEDGRGTRAVLVEVPAPIHLAGQDLVGHVADETLVEAQAGLIEQPIPGQGSLPVGDGSLEAARTLAADLRREPVATAGSCGAPGPGSHREAPGAHPSPTGGPGPGGTRGGTHPRSRPRPRARLAPALTRSTSS